MQANMSNLHPSIVDAEGETKKMRAVQVQPMTTQQEGEAQVTETEVAETPFPLFPSPIVEKKPGKKGPARVSSRDLANTRMAQEQCRRLCLSLFAREQNSIRSLGFTSSIEGEGKSFLSIVTARILARDSNDPVVLVECDWEHPTLHEHFGIPATPGLAEWLRGMCSESDIRHQVAENLTVIPAGDGAQDAVKLLKQVRQNGLLNMPGHANDLLIVDLPSVITTSYGSLAASLVDKVVVVVRSEVTPASVVAETCAQLEEVSVHGIILNQGASRIPRWLRRLL